VKMCGGTTKGARQQARQAQGVRVCMHSFDHTILRILFFEFFT